MMTITTPEDIIRAAASVGRDAAEGRLTPAQLEAQARAEVLAIAGEIVGPGDPLWEVQCDIARGVLAAGGVPADELSEWLAVARHRAGTPVDQLDGDQALPGAVSLASGAHSPEIDAPVPELVAEAAAEPVAKPEPVAPVAPLPAPAMGYDPTAGWQPGNSRRY